MPACAIEGKHQLSAQPLPKRVLGDKRFQLADELLVAAEREVGVDAIGERGEANFLESCDLCLCKGVEREIGERGSAPERERFEQRPSRQPRTPCAQSASALLNEPLKSFGVELVRLHPEEVAGGPRDQKALLVASGAPTSQRLAQLGDVDLDDLHGCRRRVTVPELVDQTINRDDLVSVEQQDGQQRSLLDATQGNLAPLRPDLNRPEDPKLHLRSEA